MDSLKQIDVKCSTQTVLKPKDVTPNSLSKTAMIRLDNLDYRAISRLILTTCHRRWTHANFAKRA